jgi:2,4-dienoyl-CoA reductase (NADPH2)
VSGDGGAAAPPSVTAGLDLLLEPLRLGGHEAPSRVAFTAHTTNLGAGGLPSAAHAQYYERRARGGAGLIVIEEVCVHPSDHPLDRSLRGHDPAIVPAYARVAEAVRPHGALLCVQLTHSGMQGSGHPRRQAIWAASAVPNPSTMEMPKVMEAEDIAALVEGFTACARLAMAGGLHGVEVNAGQHSLLRQFLSPLTNRRGDAYGGGLEGRARLLREVLSAVRGAVGPSGLVGLRLCADEFAPWAGITPEQAPEIAAHLLVPGGVDWISVVVGSIYSIHATRAGMHTPPGYALEVARAVRGVAGSVPVLATGSLVDATLAAGAIASGAADGVEMTRALIADPDLVARLREGRPDAVRPCIRCNQDCVVRTAQNALVSCIHNPEAGHEAAFPAPSPAARRRRVLVVGGGPAGMEAARLAALRGHRVTLLERAGQLGGTPALVATAPLRAPMGEVGAWLAARLAELDVEVRLGVEATAESVLDAAAEVVVLATGARQRPVEGPEAGAGAGVVGVRDVLRGLLPGDGRVAILDREGGYPAIDAAEAAAATGRPVVMVSEDGFVSSRLGLTGEFAPWYRRAAALGIELIPQTVVVGAAPGELMLRHRFGDQTRRLEGVGAVVVADHELADDALHRALCGRVAELHRAGDCLAPRRVLHAVLEGNRTGRLV